MKRTLVAAFVSTVLAAAASCGGGAGHGGGGNSTTHASTGGAAPDAGDDAPSPPADAGDDAPSPPADAGDDAPSPPPLDAGPDAPTVAPHPCPPPDPQDCAPGPGTGDADQCFDGPSCYLPTIQAGVHAMIDNHPEWFTPDPAHSDCPKINDADLDSFLDGVVAYIEAQGLCAIRDPNAYGEELTIKHDNGYAESFDIVASWGCARYGGGIYTGYCAPAWW
jgi:hypothetical protein